MKVELALNAGRAIRGRLAILNLVMRRMVRRRKKKIQLVVGALVERDLGLSYTSSLELSLSLSTPTIMTEEPLFDPSLKKKSKKKTVDFAAELDAELNQDAQPEESSTPATAASDDKPVEAVPAAVESAGVGADDDMFGGMKKKSKSKKKFAMDLDLVST